jgi:hypothetical protein
VQPCPRQRRLGLQVPVGEQVVVRHRQLAAGHLTAEPGSVLDDQRVRGHVVDPCCDHGVQRGLPVVGGLAGCPVDEVEIDVAEAGVPGFGDGGLGPAGTVPSVEYRQHVCARRLHAERNPVEPGMPQRTQRLRSHRLGVRFGRDLRVGCEPERLVDAGQDPGEIGGGQKGRRAATEEDGVDDRGGAVEHTGGQGDLGQHSVCVGGLVGAAAQLGGRVGVEVAVAAPAGAERHVHVDAEAPPADIRQRRRRKCPVAGSGFTLGQRSRHAL